MEQTQMNIVLTGFQRFQLVKLWRKRGAEGDKEDFIKKICSAKGILYVPPIKVERKMDV